jgi:hypothetical protein
MKVDQVISLGFNCEPMLQLRRLGMASPLTIFDNAIIEHRPLVRILRTDFRELFAGEVHVECHKSGLRFYHHRRETLASGFHGLVARRIERFRAARSRRVLFVRAEPADHDLFGRFRRLHAALAAFGFREFELSMAYRGESEPPAGCFRLCRPLDNPQRPWRGSRADWDDWFRHIAARVELP